jgi:hypothetical protein
MGDELLLVLGALSFFAILAGAWKLGGSRAAAATGAALLPLLTALWGKVSGKREGRSQAIDEAKERIDDAVERANVARADARERDVRPDELRESDGFRRD